MEVLSTTGPKQCDVKCTQTGQIQRATSTLIDIIKDAGIKWAAPNIIRIPDYRFSTNLVS